MITPNSPAQRRLLVAGIVGTLTFNATYLVDGALRPGYDSFRQPVSALSLGPGGWVQVTNFVLFGALGCVTAPAVRAALSPGIGAMWYPRLKVVAGLMLIATGVFSQDPGLGYPVGVAALAQHSLHAQIHNIVSYISLATNIVGFCLLARRFRREPNWKGWATYAVITALLMMGFLFTFGSLIRGGGPGGIFEKLASVTASVFGISVTTRLLARGGRVSAAELTLP